MFSQLWNVLTLELFYFARRYIWLTFVLFISDKKRVFAHFSDKMWFFEREFDFILIVRLTIDFSQSSFASEMTFSHFAPEKLSFHSFTDIQNITKLRSTHPTEWIPTWVKFYSTRKPTQSHKASKLSQKLWYNDQPIENLYSFVFTLARGRFVQITTLFVIISLLRLHIHPIHCSNESKMKNG